MATPPDPDAAAVLEYWFGSPDAAADVAPNNALWFGGGEAVDEEIRRRFGERVAEARAGRLSGWCDTAAGTLALVVLLDQFSRNLHRGHGATWACDPACQRIVLRALALGFDRALGVVQRGVLLLTFQHAEDRLMQRAGVRLYAQLAAEAPPHHQQTTAAWLEYAIKHRAVVEQFGRFPHRNAAIGRKTTAKERAFLDEHGAGF